MSPASFGPWTTSLSIDSTLLLSTFWRHRMTRLSFVARGVPAVRPGRSLGILIAATVIGAMPGLRAARSGAAAAVAAMAGESAPAAKGTPLAGAIESSTRAAGTADGPIIALTDAAQPQPEAATAPLRVAAPVAVPAPVGNLRVRQTVLDAAAFLSGRQNDDGSWGNVKDSRFGFSGLCTLALLRSGAAPQDLRIRRAVEFLRIHGPGTGHTGSTYEVALQTVVFSSVDPAGHLELIQRNVEWFERAQAVFGPRQGGWRYTVQPGADDADLSCTGFAIWGLDAAARSGAKIRRETWQSALAYLTAGQKPDGGWGYTLDPKSPPTRSMTASALASTATCLSWLQRPGERSTPAQAKLLDDGLHWLASKFSVRQAEAGGFHLYSLLMLRRACDATHTAALGEHDWRREMGEYVVEQRDPATGAFREAAAGSDPTMSTAFAILALSEGTQGKDQGREK